jgi:hypothetical protein
MAKSTGLGRTVWRTGSVAIALLLSACSGSSGFFGTPDSGEAEGGGAARTASLPPPAAPATAPAPVPAPTPGRAEPINPKRLVGLTREQVTALIGRPGVVNDNPPATVWVYRTEGCSLDVMFYMDIGTRTFRALAYEIKPNGSDHLAGPECVGRIRAVRNVH